MSVPTTNPSLLDMQVVYGDPNGATPTIPLDLFYAGRTVVPNPPPASAYGTIPVWAGSTAASGSISIGVFRGTSAAPTVQVISVIISINTANVSMRQLALDNGWNGSNPLDLTVTINAGVTVYSLTTAASAMAPKFNADPSFPAGSIIKLINNGTIAGAGGAGGNGGAVVGSSVFPGLAGSDGGTGFNANAPLIIYNYGTIGGGGGGGGGGGSIYATDGAKKPTTYGVGGSGGGAGRVLGTPGVGNTASGNTTNQSGVSGNSGTIASPGVGGAAAQIAGEVQGGAGGAGGNLGESGSSGGVGSKIDGALTATIGPGGSGGAAGPALINSTNITWGNFGTILGTGFSTGYTISRSVASVNEGGSVTFTLVGTIPPGATIPYTITGISSSDVGGASLTGNFTSAAPSRTLTLSSDGLTEGTETITITLNSPSTPPSTMPSQTCTVNDTSTGGGTILPSGSGTWSSGDATFNASSSATLTFMPNGTVAFGPSDGGSNPNWFTVTTTGIGSSYWIRASNLVQTVVGAGSNTGTFNTWLPLSSGQTFGVVANQVGSGNTRAFTVTFEFATDSGGTNIVATHTLCSFEAEYYF